MKSIIVIPAVMMALTCCDRILSEPVREPGLLKFGFDPAEVRSGAEFPDTNSFLLSICDSTGHCIYSGIYADSPKQFSLAPGTYTVTAGSGRFSEPVFDSPCYGDNQKVSIRSGMVSAVHLTCALLNSGIRLQCTEPFKAEYPGGTIYLGSASGTLVYDYGEKRTGYFKPGLVWLQLSYGGATKTLFSREIFAREVLTLRLCCSYSVMEVPKAALDYGDGLTMELDTTCVWKEDEFWIGGAPDDGGEGDGPVEPLDAYSVERARGLAADGGANGVWVYGYVVGGDCTQSSCSFGAPFSSNTNIVLGSSSFTRERGDCLTVQLSKGDIRSALNLVDNPGNLRKKVWLKGDIVSKYYGIPGIQNLTEYLIE